jgi:hypothetical protein
MERIAEPELLAIQRKPRDIARVQANLLKVVCAEDMPEIRHKNQATSHI